MSKKGYLIALVAAVLAVIAVLPGGASAHHRPDHETGKPSPEPTSEPSPEPSETPVMVNVELKVEIPVRETGMQHELNRCDLVVPEGATGYEILQAAVEVGCIESFETDWGPSNPFDDFEPYYVHRLRCVDDLCDQKLWPVFLYWGTSANNLDIPFAVEGAVMEAEYERWACQIDIWCLP